MLPGSICSRSGNSISTNEPFPDSTVSNQRHFKNLDPIDARDPTEMTSSSDVEENFSRSVANEERDRVRDFNARFEKEFLRLKNKRYRNMFEEFQGDKLKEKMEENGFRPPNVTVIHPMLSYLYSSGMLPPGSNLSRMLPGPESSRMGEVDNQLLDNIYRDGAEVKNFHPTFPPSPMFSLGLGANIPPYFPAPSGFYMHPSMVINGQQLLQPWLCAAAAMHELCRERDAGRGRKSPQADQFHHHQPQHLNSNLPGLTKSKLFPDVRQERFSPYKRSSSRGGENTDTSPVTRVCHDTSSVTRGCHDTSLVTRGCHPINRRRLSSPDSRTGSRIASMKSVREASDLIYMEQMISGLETDSIPTNEDSKTSADNFSTTECDKDT